MQYTRGDVLLTLDNVSLKLGDNLILRDINTQIHDIIRAESRGRIISILGKSGAGKSKLFEVISGLLPPTTGTVKIGVDQQPVHPGKVGVVQQNYPLFNHRTVYSNLKVATKACPGCPNKDTCPDHGKDVDKRVMEMLEKVQLTKHKDKYPIQLSGGQRQRVAIAQQLLCSEQFLLLDEPFSGLDPIMVHEISNMLIDIANQNEYNTLILVSHDLMASAAISDTIWMIGKDKNEDGSDIPGAYIKYVYDLMERNLAWKPDIQKDPHFLSLIDELHTKFLTL